MVIWLKFVCAVLCVMDFAKAAKYTNQWVAKIHGGEEVALRVAKDLGYTFKEQIIPFDDHYLLVHNELPEVSLRASSHLTGRLLNFDEVKWAEQQKISERSKRGFLPEYKLRSPDWEKLYGGEYIPSGGSSGSQYTYSKVSNINDDPPADPKEVGKGDFDSIPNNAFSTNPADDAQLNTYSGVTKHVKCLSSKTSSYEDVFNDPMWHSEWYVQDCRVMDSPVMDHNVVPAYKMGYTGKDVTIMIPDDGIEHGHRDLVGNFDPDLSYDFCQNLPGCEPDKRQYNSYHHSEGTMCAGIIGMVANNKRCGVGIAYHAKIAGARILGCSRYMYAEAKGLVHQLSKVDIYSISWGALDDGKNMDPISKMTAAAFDKGIAEGRNGKGAIYVVGSGNGKHIGDNCGADGIANYVGNIVIGNTNQIGKTTYYSERCTAILATAYSGDSKMESVVSTIEYGGCVSSSTGSAASVSIASGIIALALDAKSELTYRDVMHLIVMSSEVAPLADNDEETWYKNGRGFWVSNDFGFGLLNAENLVTLAKHWKRVPKKHTCEENFFTGPTRFSVQEGFKYTFNAKACHGDDHKVVEYLEHIELESHILYPYRGAISIYIKSPSGTKSTLLESRQNDNDDNGLQSWTIKSVHNWGENPRGRWTVMVKIANVPGLWNTIATAQKLTLTFHGTEEKPAHYKHPRKYAAFRLPDGRTSNM